jgi:hypothetical protein
MTLVGLCLAMSKRAVVALSIGIAQSRRGTHTPGVLQRAKAEYAKLQ